MQGNLQGAQGVHFGSMWELNQGHWGCYCSSILYYLD